VLAAKETALKSAKDNDMILIIGSIYLVGEVL
jgi:folylpolyglutamate synthase/dihydropteroate synthase